ncbi:MAG: 4-deoxy-4-formamido-L-arabinose-phosphoundecaprenol deformylase [Planctomycetes bacterium]|nr:4-deoxy-4-formamido-L-arabinose-phosphoundecaprenol deformylase [Planctomycetota bacterium]
MKLGLRVDVDTLRGTRLGVPSLLAVLARRDVRASFFFSVGPDNMGRHLWRLLRPAFLVKMLRSRAASLYGWDILLRGTLWPGPLIGARAGEAIAAAARAGHEVGLHAWDHHAWQAHVDAWSADELREVTRRGMEELTRLTGARPTCSASPGWRASEAVLSALRDVEYAYRSDCRGESVFVPEVGGAPQLPPQVPVTLPTYDELVGRGGVDDESYNERLLELLEPGRLNVLTIHAEVEGIARAALFEDFLERALAAGWELVPLGELVPRGAELPVAPLEVRGLPGREGVLAHQGRATGTYRS